MDKCLTAKDFNSFQNQKVTHALQHEVGNNKKKLGLPDKKTESHEPPVKRIKSIKPDQVPLPALKQRFAATSEVSSHFQCDHSPSVEAAHQSLSTGEFYFANDPLTQQRIIDHLRHEQPETYCIRSLDDLEKHGLMKQTWVEEGKLHKAEGRLFIDEPMTLVFDLTTMTPGDIASFNDLLQVGPKCSDKPLGDRIRRVFLVNDAMLDGSQPANPDLWRRLGQMPQKAVPEAGMIADSVTDETLLAQKTTKDIPAGVHLITIDFATTDDWHRRLFGGITLNERGRLVFSEGALANLKDNTHIVFKNAPWKDTGFQTALATAIRVGGFTANRQWFRLPEQLSLSAEYVCATELNAQKDQTIKDSALFSPQSTFVVINGTSLEGLKGHVRIEGTGVVQTDMLANLLRDCRQLVLTGELDEQQWLWLLTRLDELPEDKRPLLFDSLPAELLLRTGHWQGREACNQHAATDGPGSSITYEINPGDTLESLQQVNLTSQNHFTFSLTNTLLMEALVKGRPIILNGVECNPELAANLETLLLPAPYLFIHGRKINLPGAQVTFMKPSGEQTTGSALINAILGSANSQQQSTQNPVYSLLKSLPRSSQRNYPNRPPWTEGDFQYRFEHQAESERLMDGSPELLPCHQRRALHVLLAKAYRGDPKVYSFIKAKIASYYPDQPADNRANRSALEQWLAQHPNPELKDIRAHFWTLARHCPITVPQCIEEPDHLDESLVQQLATYVVGAAPRARQRFLARKLRVNWQEVGQKGFYSGNVRSTLRDILIAHRPSLKANTIISKTVETLENQISSALMADQTDQQKSQQIGEILAACLFQSKPDREGSLWAAFSQLFYWVWPKGEYSGSNRTEYKDLLPEHCQDLPDVLVAGQRHTRARQERRLVQLARAVEEHPIVFLQGEAGVGKNFLAQAVAARAGYPTCQVIQLGPNQTSETLFGGQKLVEHPTHNGDHHTEFRQGPLLRWASSKDPAVLVLKNADQAPVGLLAPLAGLTRQPRVLHYQGREYRLTEKHRIILTGHPEHYPGRHLDDTLKSRVPTFFYHPLPDSVLARAIILPNLPEAWPDSLKQQACERILTLFNHFRELLSGDLTTPRDITDVLATVRQILSHCPATGVTSEQVNALVRRAFMDSLGGAVTDEYRQQLNTLNLWYQGQYREDPAIMAGVDRAFDDFQQQLQAANPDGDFSAAPVRQLVYRYWQSLDKEEPGRTTILVEGPAGWGKDFVLDRTIRLWQQQQGMNRSFVHINANPNQWTTLVESIERAMSRGDLIAISELNLIPSSYVEELLKNVLTGDAAPGFRLFATINPGYFDGREALSKALTSRCTRVRLGALAPEELAGLVQGLPDMPDGLPQWLAGHFHQLSTALYQQNCPVQLALDDLFSSARHLASQCPEQWHHALQQHLSLPFRALTTDLPPVQEDTARLERINKEEQRRQALEAVANSFPGLSTPITVKFGSVPRSNDREITVTPQATDQDVVMAMQKVMRNGDNSKSAVRSVGHRGTGRVGRPTVFGDIVAPSHYKVTRYYPKYPYDAHQYRLSFLETGLDEDGQLRNHSIDPASSTITPLAGWPDVWRTDLRSDELPGKIVLSLDNQWHSLPALSRSDQLRAIRCTPQTAIDLARCEQTGVLLIKSRGEYTTSPVTIDFIIAPDQLYFTQLELGEPVLLQEGLSSQRLEDLFKKHIFAPNSCEAYVELRDINEIGDIPERLAALMDWLDTLSATQNVTGQGEQLLLNILSKKQGVCRHKAMIFQMLCHYWGVPALQVQNVSHCFAEISPDGGLTWRQYQLDGGGESSADITEPDWGDYCQPDCSVLMPPFARRSARFDQSISSSTGGSDLYKKIEDAIKKLEKQIINNQSVSTEIMHQLKKNYSVFNKAYFLDGWWILLSPQMFHQFGENLKDWQSIIEKNALNMADTFHPSEFRHIKIGMEQLYNSIQKKETDVHYLNWLCDLYHYVPYLKYPLLSILQKLSGLTDSCQLQSRVKLMLMSYPLSPQKFNIGMRLDVVGDRESSEECVNIVKTLAMSRSLMNRLSQHRIHRQLHHQPVGNSIIIPEKLMSGEAAFLNISKSTSYKPIIFDCAGLVKKEVLRRINMRLESGVKSEIIEKSCEVFIESYIEVLFFYWLVAHHMNETVSPIWLGVRYQYYSEAAQPHYCECLTYADYEVIASAQLKLPPKRIKDCFNQPSAVVLQNDDLLLLLDEFLSLIAA